MSIKSLFAFILTVVVAGVITSAPAEAKKKGWGCFKVTANALNIRKRPYAKSQVIATARRGDILIKRKIICTPRGFWCAVWHSGSAGYADKKYIKKVKCLD